ncbi:MAG: hypothetical protein GXO77_15755 [Calditrichaeota bacterium]|nr:hypothetical protein [Calditrichota bacterium]
MRFVAILLIAFAIFLSCSKESTPIQRQDNRPSYSFYQIPGCAGSTLLKKA